MMNRMRKALIGTALAGSTLLGGGIGAALLNGSATAQTTPTTAAPPSAPAPPTDAQPPNQRPGFDPASGGHVGQNGTKEALLTGDTAKKVKAAALAAVPGGTVQRAENDAEGSPYEAHMTNADGSQVTVKVDSGFKVTGIENGAR